MAFNMSVIENVLTEVSQVDNVPEGSGNNNTDDVKKQLDFILKLKNSESVGNDFALDFCDFREDFDREYRMEFDPILIGSDVLSKIDTIGKETVVDDICKMIGFYVQGGYNLEYMMKKTKTPEFASLLKRLINTYNLVSKATDSESITLYRICASFPELTCSYLDVTPTPLISFQTMKIFTNNYPKVMMTPLFAYLIPNKTDRFCTLLKEAHMVFRYALYYCTRHNVLSDINFDAEIISQCIKYTHSEIIRSHLPDEMQISFLKKYELITVDNTRISVADSVRIAANMWKNIRQLDIPTAHISDNSDYWYLNF